MLKIILKRISYEIDISHGSVFMCMSRSVRSVMCKQLCKYQCLPIDYFFTRVLDPCEVSQLKSTTTRWNIRLGNNAFFVISCPVSSYGDQVSSNTADLNEIQINQNEIVAY